MMTLRLLVLCVLALFPLSAHAQERWVVYYTNTLKPEKFQSFDLIVFDSHSHPPIAPLKAQGKTLLGYISLGEAESYRPYFKELQDKKIFVKQNTRWKGHHIIDVRNPEWTNYAIEHLIPAILDQGFDGIMIDTIDSVIDLEKEEPQRYKGMQQAAAGMIKTIRARYPDMKIMLNRGFDILPQVVHDIDMVMAESTYSDMPEGGKKPVWLPHKTRSFYVDLLQAAQAQNPQLKIYTIDYWQTGDKRGMRRIYAAQRADGFIPYVSDFSLERLTREP